MPDSSIELFNSSKHRVYNGEFWNVIMSYDQVYLGRCIVYLKSRAIADTMALTREEHDELWHDILPRLTTVLKKTFNPDRINFAHLANFEKHVHWHVVPRYDTEREFAGMKFVDPNPNSNFKFQGEDPSMEKLDKIHQEILKNFNE